MIRIGFGMTTTSVGFGLDPNSKGSIKGIRMPIGTVVMKAAEIVITVPVKARAMTAYVRLITGR